MKSEAQVLQCRRKDRAAPYEFPEESGKVPTVILARAGLPVVSNVARAVQANCTGVSC